MRSITTKNAILTRFAKNCHRIHHRVQWCFCHPTSRTSPGQGFVKDPHPGGGGPAGRPEKGAGQTLPRALLGPNLISSDPPPSRGGGPEPGWMVLVGWTPWGGGGRVPSGFRKPLYLALAMDTHRKCGGPTRFFVNIWAISLVSNGVDPQMEGQCVISSLKTWTQTPSSRAGRTMTESG